jgi:predicted ribosome quality control (RQC) complex YloA/Tae2 family protein
MILQIYVTSKGKQTLKIGKNMFLTEEKTDSSEQPQGFCMLLRKYLTNSRVKEIKQIGFERITEIVFETKEGTLNLFAEFFDKGNVIFVKEGIIIAPLQQQKWKEREIKAKIEYKYPVKEYDINKIKAEEMKELLINSKQDIIVKCLAVDLGLGGLYSEEACLIASIDKNEKPSNVDYKKMFEAVKGLLNKKIEAKAYYIDGKLKDVTPFSLKKYSSLEFKTFESFNKAIDSTKGKESTEEKQEQKTTKYNKEIERIERMIKKQEEQIKEMEREALEYQKKGEKIYENYQLIEELINEVKKVKGKLSIKEMKEKIKGHKIVKDFNEKGEVIIEI